MTTLVMAAILIFGFFGYRALPVSDLPNVDFPTIQVNAVLPGASPEKKLGSGVSIEKLRSAVNGYPAKWTVSPTATAAAATVNA